MEYNKVEIDGKNLTLSDAQKIASGSSVELGPDTRETLKKSQDLVEKMSLSSEPIYGVNTGFGYLANQKISPAQEKQLQRNILVSHASGYGNPLSQEETRLAMALRLNVLLKGPSGVHYALCEAFRDLINAEIYPIIPEYGSVGASGDLAPLAHLALPLIGQGTVRYKNKEMPAAEALKLAGLKPYELQKKEGLALVNGTQIMLSVGGLALLQAIELLDLADQITALSYEALMGSPKALDPLIHLARGQKGQIESAENILKALEGSYILNDNHVPVRVQDPYSLRCAPQIHGASRDSIRHSKEVIERELNASTDNPLVFPSEEKILSGGNFHGQCLAMAFDIAAMAVAEIGNVSERRLELLLNPQMSGLSAFLVPEEGINSGYMAAQYLSASIVNENKLLANPSCTDSIPGNVGIEDHVSMGMTSARKLRKLVNNLRVVLAVELTAACQAIDLRQQKVLGKETCELYNKIRTEITELKEDRIISEDIKTAVNILERNRGVEAFHETFCKR